MDGPHHLSRRAEKLLLEKYHPQRKNFRVSILFSSNRDLICKDFRWSIVDTNCRNRDLPFTLRMSQDYRIYDDRWRLDKAVKDEPVDVSAEFEASQGIMTEIAGMLNSQQILPKNMEKIITEEMAKVVFGSNKIERLGLGLDETFRLCLAVFEGDEELGTAER